MNKKKEIRRFYEQEIEKEGERITDFKYKCQIGGTVFGTEDLTNKNICKLSPSPMSSAISKHHQLPKIVLDACDRHYWYIQHSLGVISVLKIPFKEITTFAICIDGYVDDGWDNSCSFIEIYDDRGELVGSASIPSFENGDYDWKWMNRPITGDNYYTPAPSWSDGEEEKRQKQEDRDVYNRLRIRDLTSIPEAFLLGYQRSNPVIYIGNLPPEVTKKDLINVIFEDEKIEQLYLLKDAIGSFAFVEMVDRDRAREVIAKLKGTDWMGFRLEFQLFQL